MHVHNASGWQSLVRRACLAHRIVSPCKANVAVANPCARRIGLAALGVARVPSASRRSLTRFLLLISDFIYIILRFNSLFASLGGLNLWHLCVYLFGYHIIEIYLLARLGFSQLSSIIRHIFGATFIWGFSKYISHFFE